MEKTLEQHLHECLEAGNTKKAKYIVSLLGDNVDKLYKGKSLLLWAEEFSNEEIIKILEQKGAKRILSDEEQIRLNNALFDKAKHGDLTEVLALIKKGADVNFISQYGFSLLDVVVAENHVELAKKLIKLGADVNKEVDPNGGWTTMMRAKSVEMLDALIEGGADLEQKDYIGYTALMRLGYRLDFAEKMIENGADINAVNNNGENVLFSVYNVEILDYLIKKGAKVDLRGNSGSSVLMSVTSQGKEACVERLLKENVDINAQNNYGETALLIASNHGYVEIAKRLLEAKADTNIKDNRGFAPLIVLARSLWDKNKMEIAGELIKNGADVNIRDNNGNTALMWAAGNSNFWMVELLINAGADVNIKNNDGKTVLMLMKNSETMRAEILKCVKEKKKKDRESRPNFINRMAKLFE